MKDTCPGCDSSLAERTHGGDIAVYECGTESWMCLTRCCGGYDATDECDRNRKARNGGED